MVKSSIADETKTSYPGQLFRKRQMSQENNNDELLARVLKKYLSEMAATTIPTTITTSTTTTSPLLERSFEEYIREQYEKFEQYVIHIKEGDVTVKVNKFKNRLDESPENSTTTTTPTTTTTTKKPEYRRANDFYMLRGSPAMRIRARLQNLRQSKQLTTEPETIDYDKSYDVETTTLPWQPPVYSQASSFNQFLQPSQPNNGNAFPSYQNRQITETSTILQPLTTTKQSYFGRQPSLFESTSPSSLCKIN